LKGTAPPSPAVDRLDIAIFRELVQQRTTVPLSTDPLRSLRSIAKRLEVDKDTVRSRIQRLRRGGFLSAPFVFPNPRLLGMALEQTWLDVRPGHKPALIDSLRADERVVVISDHLGDSLTFAALTDPGSPANTPHEALVQLPAVRGARSAPIPFPTSELLLTRLDWRIMQALQSAERPSLGSLSRALRVSPRTAKRRLDRMIAGYALFVIPRFDPKALDGSVADFAVFYGPDAHKAKVDRQVMGSLSDCLFHADLGDPGHSFFNFIVNSVAKGRAAVAWVGSTPGVHEARLDFVVERIELLSHMEMLLHSRSPMPPARSTHRGGS